MINLETKMVYLDKENASISTFVDKDERILLRSMIGSASANFTYLITLEELNNIIKLLLHTKEEYLKIREEKIDEHTNNLQTK